MERKTALKNIFHCNHLLIKSFYCPVTAPALQPHGAQCCQLLHCCLPGLVPAVPVTASGQDYF